MPQKIKEINKIEIENVFGTLSYIFASCCSVKSSYAGCGFLRCEKNDHLLCQVQML